ncbi:MAG: ComF family protein, partial [Defluviitaleaceae bacterium]|nr:ComF family protein [Defluviitaleaceae bacterium]
IYPQPCPVCNEIANNQQGICGECYRSSLNPISGETCIKCGKPAEHRGTICEDCTGRLLHFDRNISVFTYDPLLRRAIHRFKYSFNPYSASVFGKEIGKALAQGEYVEFFAKHRKEFAVISVPLHKKRYKKRGYNQSEILAEETAAVLGMLFIKNCIGRTKNTVPQSEISQFDERTANIKDAFTILNPDFIRAKNILVVDDIYTTGATLNELSRIIKPISGKRIFTATLAISSGKKQHDDLYIY